MSSPYDKDYSTLNWIKGQVDQRLEQARFKLEEAESGGTPAEELGVCASYLHEVRGSLRMVELYGPTMVVEEMERLTRQLAAGKVEDNDSAYSAIMRGLVQLPDYLDRIQSGHRDVPTALLPLLNEVRAAGGRDKLDEAHIFSPRLSIPVPEKYRGAPRRIKLDQQKAAAAKLRLAFQSSLANWLREQGNPDAQLKRMMKVVEMLRKASAEAPMWRMLWALEGVLEALLVEGLDANQDVRSAMRQVDRELKRFADGGDPEMRRRPPDDLTRTLLYHVTVCKATSPKVTQLRETYGLVELLPRPEELAHAEGAMAGRNRELLGTVASAIREDIYRIKDALDVFIGDEKPDPQSLASLSEKLDSVADTLGMLGMNRPRQRVLDQAQVLNDIVNGVIEGDEEALMGIAGNLLRVEAALDDQESSLSSEEDEDDAEAGGDQPPPSEVRKVVVSLMGEGLTNLARAKSALNDHMADPSESRLIEAVPEMLSDVSGALRMVQLDTLADACGSVSRFVARIREFGPQPQFMDTLADALSIIEMYMEVVRDQQPGRQRLSEQLTQVLEKLAAIENELEEETSEPASAEPQAEQTEAEPVAEPEPEPEPVVEAEPQAEAAEPAASVAPGIEFAEDIDDDIREVFVEEVEEELAKVRKLYPIWRNDNDDQESLTTLRRCFHTLKGSGRLVGARSIGEFAWSIENLYNRIIDKTIEIDDNVYKVLDDAADALEQLYGQLKDGSAVSLDVQEIEQRAFALADGKPLPEAAPAEEEAPAEDVESAADELEEPSAPEPQEPVAGEERSEADEPDESVEAVIEAEADDEQSPLDLHPDDQLPEDGEDWALAEDDSVSDGDPADAIDADSLLSEDIETSDEALDELGTDAVDEDEQAMDSLLRGWEEEDSDSGAGQEPEMADSEPRSDFQTETDAVEKPVDTEQDDSALATAESDDQQLMAIFEKEARGHVESLREYVEASQEAARPLAIDVDLLRAAHTLNGAACMARIEAVSDIAGLLEGYVKGLSQEKKRPSKPGLACFADAVAHFTSVLDLIAAGETDLPLNRELADRTRALLEELSDPSLTKASMSDILESGAIDDDDLDVEQAEQEPSLELEQEEPETTETSSSGISSADAEAADSWALEGEEGSAGDSIELSSDGDEESLDDLIASWDDDSSDEEEASAASEIPGFGSGWDLDESDSDADIAFESEQDDEPAGEEEVSESDSETTLEDDALALSDSDDLGDDDLDSFVTDHAEEEQAEPAAESVDDLDHPDSVVESGSETDDEPLAATDEPEAEQAGDDEPALEETVSEADSSEFDTAADLQRLLDEAPQEADDSMALEDPDRAADVGPLLAEDTEQQDAPVEQPGASDTTAERPWEADPELLEVFLEEGAEILDSLDEQVQHLRDGDTSGSVLSSLQRELHTLKGSARMASVEAVGDLAHRLETLLEACSHGKRPVDDDVVSATESVLDHLHNAISCLQTQKDLPDSSSVEDRLADAMESPSTAKPAQARDADASDAVQDDAPSEAGEDRLVELADDADAELVEIFLQEGREILDAADGLVEKLRVAGEDIDPATLEDLQRELHTLKGGARMAGVEPIGELGHNLESLLEKVTTADGAPDASLLSLVVRVLDYLNRQLTALESGQSMPAGDALNQEIHRYIEDGGPAVKEAAEAPVVAEPVEVQEAEGDEAQEAQPEEPPVEPEASPKALEPAQAPASGRAGLLDFGPISSVSAISGANIIPLTRGAAARAGSQGRKESTEVVRVRSSLLDNLVNYAGEVSIYRSRLEQQMSTFRFNLVEFDQTVLRLREQLRKMEIETEAQILSRHQREQEAGKLDFDPLELDRYSQLQLLSRSLSESLSDLVSIQDLLEDLTRESETLLLQQSRVSGELQEGLMRTRMVPFSNVVPRLRRIVRQTTSELGKQARLVVEGAEGEMDRTVLEKLTPPLEHMLRNALGHGLEMPDERTKAGKPDEGTVTVNVAREASEVVVRVTDDGAGIHLERVRARAIERGLMAADAELGERDIMRFIMEAGFSTAETVTKLSGRGVGMDVVNSEIKQLNGTLDIDSEYGKGTTFTVRLPFTLSVSQAIMIKLADEEYAVPLSSIEGVYRMPREEFEDTIQDAEGKVRYAGSDYTLYDLGLLLGRDSMEPPEEGNVPLLMIRTGDQRAAVRVERLLGSREIVIKSVGPQLSSIPGVSGATVLGDGSVVLILDLAPLARKAAALHRQQPELADERVAEFDTSQDRQLRIMVVDDSITMRKVATRMLERHDFEVHTAKDGVDAVASLHDMVPDLMLLDIEMPRMDGYELATHVRNTSRLKHVPIIMITSRTGQKHRQRAFDIGVDRYLGKPYQEAELLATINELLGREVADIE